MISVPLEEERKLWLVGVAVDGVPKYRLPGNGRSSSDDSTDSLLADSFADEYDLECRKDGVACAHRSPDDCGICAEMLAGAGDGGKCGGAVAILPADWLLLRALAHRSPAGDCGTCAAMLLEAGEGEKCSGAAATVPADRP